MLGFARTAPLQRGVFNRVFNSFCEYPTLVVRDGALRGCEDVNET
jgi:hypothetical protein